MRAIARSSTLGARLRTVSELARMAHQSRRWWLTPMFLLLGVLGLALAGLQAIPYVAPFIYSIF
jgi:hypothetical protein